LTLFVCVCLWVCVSQLLAARTCQLGLLQNNNQLISLKLVFMIGSMSPKNRLTFGGYPVLDTDSGSLFYFPRHCRMGLFRRFISIFDTVDWPLFTKHGEMTDKRMNPLNVKIDPADIRIRINRKSESESRITFGGGFVEVVGLRQPLRMMSPMMSPSASRFIVYILGI